MIMCITKRKLKIEELKMNFNNCKICEKKLTGLRKRQKPSTCYNCLGIETNNYEFSNFCKSILKAPQKEIADDEMIFEDDPKAILENEMETGKVIKHSVGYVYTEVSMADLIKEIKS